MTPASAGGEQQMLQKAKMKGYSSSFLIFERGNSGVNLTGIIYLRPDATKVFGINNTFNCDQVCSCPEGSIFFAGNIPYCLEGLIHNCFQVIINIYLVIMMIIASAALAFFGVYTII